MSNNHTPAHHKLLATCLSCTKAAMFWGAISIALYILLFAYSAEIINMARSVRQGDKLYFLAPIAIAFVFSLVHGAFTGHFWKVIGLMARPATPAPATSEVK